MIGKRARDELDPPQLDLDEACDSSEGEDDFIDLDDMAVMARVKASPDAPPVCLPPATRSSRRPLTLVLDLDETLVHCSLAPIPDPDFSFPLKLNDVEIMLYGRKRPHLEQFLSEASRHCEVCVFTASAKVYARRVLRIIDPTGRWIRYRLYRDSCVPYDGSFLKDLRVLGRDLATTLIVDNSPHAFAFQIDNGVPIGSWYGDRNDRALLGLVPLLERLRDATDVRPVLREQFRIAQMVSERARQLGLLEAPAAAAAAAACEPGPDGGAESGPDTPPPTPGTPGAVLPAGRGATPRRRSATPRTSPRRRRSPPGAASSSSSSASSSSSSSLASTADPAAAAAAAAASGGEAEAEVLMARPRAAAVAALLTRATPRRVRLCA